MRRVISVAAALTAVSAPAQAIEISTRVVDGQSIVLVTGEFLYKDETKFISAVRRAGRIDEVWFSSDGGNVSAALEIGRHLRKSGLATRVPRGASCASACAYAFIGGVFRAVDPRARVGVHNSTLSGDRSLLAAVTKIIRKHGAAGAHAVVTHIERSAATIAAEQARYLLEMTVSSDLMKPITNTESAEMHWLTPAELRRYNVVNQ